MNADVDKRILTLHLMWKMVATIWRSRNQALHGTTKAERDYAKKNHLDKEMLMILDLLRENQLPHRTVPLGYSFTIDSKQAWLRWEKMSLKAHQIPITNSHHRGEYTHATSAFNMGRSSQRTHSRKHRADKLADPIPSQWNHPSKHTPKIPFLSYYTPAIICPLPWLYIKVEIKIPPLTWLMGLPRNPM